MINGLKSHFDNIKEKIRNIKSKQDILEIKEEFRKFGLICEMVSCSQEAQRRLYLDNTVVTDQEFLEILKVFAEFSLNNFKVSDEVKEGLIKTSKGIYFDWNALRVKNLKGGCILNFKISSSFYCLSMMKYGDPYLEWGIKDLATLCEYY